VVLCKKSGIHEQEKMDVTIKNTFLEKLLYDLTTQPVTLMILNKQKVVKNA
jgi:hypothetical protein